MSLSMYQVSIPVFVRMLNNLSAILAKAEVFAEAKKIDSAVLVQSRLAPDMFPLARQVQIATDGVKGCAARLAGVEIPSYADTEITLPELQARIAKTIAFVESVTAAQVDGSETRAIELKVGKREMNFQGQAYLLNFVLPNLYFHVTAAYAILRHNGVEIGKLDFLGNPACGIIARGEPVVTKCIGFPAVAASDVRVLILGSLPGVKSLVRQEYYAKKQNCFWRIMGELAGFDAGAAYSGRLKNLTAKKIALWDVCASARRTGSLDSRIERATVVPNKIDDFLHAHKYIELICFNGQPAQKLFKSLVAPRLSARHALIQRTVLPSTSPAHARMNERDKFGAWKHILADYIS